MCDPLCRPESSPDYTALSMDTQTIHAPMGTRRDKQDDGQGVAHQKRGEQRSARRRPYCADMALAWPLGWPGRGSSPTARPVRPGQAAGAG